MTRTILVLMAALTAALPPTAKARLNPPPPPSGIVVHLFGEGSVMSNVLPTAPAGGSAVQGALAGQQASSAVTASGPSRTGIAAPQPAYVEPSFGDVMHQLFVTGDPNDPTRPSTGRTTNRLAD